MSKAHLHVLDAAGNWVPAGSDALGNIGGGGGASAPYGSWRYTAASGGITDTADVALKAASTTGDANYLKSLQVKNTSGTATEVVIKDGSTVIWRMKAPASMITADVISFDIPLQGTPNTALNAACITTSTETYINAQGFTGATSSQISAERTPYVEEIFDDNGNVLTSDTGAALTL